MWNMLIWNHLKVWVATLVGFVVALALPSHWSFINRVLTGWDCALLVLVRWPTGEQADLTGARALEVLRVFGYGLLAGVLLLTPAFPATALVREKIKGTLALLLNSPMRPWSIYLGKLGGVLGFTAVLLVMTLPAAAACYALGGTGTRGGITLLIAVRLIPILPFSLVSYAAGAAHVPTWRFIWTTAVGYLPITALAVYFGTKLEGLQLADPLVLGSIAGLLALLFLGHWVIRRQAPST